MSRPARPERGWRRRHDEPTEPEDSDRVPEADPPGLVRRVIDRLARRSDRG